VVVWLEDASTGAVCECTDRRSKAAREDAGVESTSKRVFGRNARGRRAGEGFTFGVVYQGFMVALFP
jgi:hypothetical protein